MTRLALSDLMEWPTTRPLTRWSHMVRFYWWLLCLFPPVTLLAALDTARTARSADEAVGLAFFTAPFVLAAFALAPFLVYRAWMSDAITRTERIILIVLALAALPFFVLVSAICSDFGGWPRGQPHPTRPLTLALTVAWVGLAIAVRRKLHRDIPSRWHQLFWLLLPLPPVTFFLAVANLLPAKPSEEPSPYPPWPFLVIASALAALFAYRALVSPTTPKLQRIFIVVACLTVLPMLVLLCAAWQIGDSWPRHAGPGRWTFFVGVVVGWMALAVATRLKLRRS